MKKFRVEYINNKRKNAFLFAHQVDDFDFEIQDGSSLGPIDLKPILNQPRALKKDGSPDLSIFAFYPKDRSMLNNISIGEVLVFKNKC